MSKLHEGLAKLSLHTDENKVVQLEAYIRDLTLWNPKFGLVHAEGDDLIIRHILDSLVGVSKVKELAPSLVADIGSGGGLPGIPLAIFCPEIEFHLVERSAKKVGFLKNAVLGLGLKNVIVHNCPYEELKDQYNMIVFRGFSPFQPDLMKHIQKKLKPNGCILAYKGTKKLTEKELSSVEDLYTFSREYFPLSVPFLKEERHLVKVTF